MPGSSPLAQAVLAIQVLTCQNGFPWPIFLSRRRDFRLSRCYDSYVPLYGWSFGIDVYECRGRIV